MEWKFRMCHSYREFNTCADVVANLGCDHELGMRVYEQYSARLSLLLLADITGITIFRVISL
jgi:hypothetical protein